jgi:hypothetical protein
LQANREEFEETVENPEPKWTHLPSAYIFSQNNARFKRYGCLFMRKISGGGN